MLLPLECPGRLDILEFVPASSTCAVAALAIAALLLAGCTRKGAEPGAARSEAPASHDHGSGAATESLPAGARGSRRSATRLRDVRIPRRAGVSGRVGFVVERYRGFAPDTVPAGAREADARLRGARGPGHLPPRPSRAAGRWIVSGLLTLPAPGDYRLATEFVARDEGGNDDHVMSSAVPRFAMQIVGRGRLGGHPPGEVDGARFKGRFVIWALTREKGPVFCADVSLFDSTCVTEHGADRRVPIWSPCGVAQSSKDSSRATRRSKVTLGRNTSSLRLRICYDSAPDGTRSFTDRGRS